MAYLTRPAPSMRAAEARGRLSGALRGKNWPRVMAASEKKVGNFYFFCVCLSLFVNIARPAEVFPFLVGARLGLVSFVLTAVAFFIADGPQIVRRMMPRGAGLMKLFLLLGFVGIPFAVWPTHALENWRHQLTLTALYFFWLPAVRSPHHLRKLVAVISLSSACLVAAMLLLDLGWAESGRASVGSMYDPNDIAMVLASFLPLTLFLFVRGGTASKAGWGIVLFGTALSVLQTGSRSGFVAVTVCFLFLLIALRTLVKTRYRVLLLVAGISFFMSPAADVAKERFESVFSGEDYNLLGRESGVGRLATWEMSLTLIGRNPVLGSGVGCSATAMGQAFGRWSASHNAFLQIGVELGVVGLIAFVLLLRTVWRNCGRSRRALVEKGQRSSLVLLAGVTQASLVSYLVGALFLSHAYSVVIPVLLVISNGLELSTRQTAAVGKSRLPSPIEPAMASI